VKGRTSRQSEAAKEAVFDAAAKIWHCGADCLREPQAATPFAPPGDRPQPNRFTFSAAVNWVNPLRPTTSGILTARKGDGAAGRGGWKKQMPPYNGTDRGCATRQHHPTRKRADFQQVFLYERT